jgi:Zn-finger nucleic acid-binding protein
MHCPACHAELTPATLAGVTLDACQGGCAGIWFDRGELKFDPPADALGRWLDELAASRTVHVDPAKRRNCPRCSNSVLMRHFSSATRAVAIDECPTCAGIWLDSGELEQIRSEHVSLEDRHRAMVKAFEEGAIDDRMALTSMQLRDSVPYATWKSRVASALVFALYAAVVSSGSGSPVPFLVSMVSLVRYCTVPLACIWFPDAIGYVFKKSPRSFVWFFGWVVLLVPVLFVVMSQLALSR